MKKKQNLEVKQENGLREEKNFFFNNIVKELRLEDTQGYFQIMRMNYDSFKKKLC